MKRFLYYNQDSVNSFLAQIEQGLLVKDSSGEEDTETFSETTSIQSDLSGDLSAKVLGVGAAMKGTLHGDDAGTEVTSNLIKSVQEKVLHDYAFERVYNHAVENGLINVADPKIGDIVLITEVPTFLDFNYFQALFSENGAIKLVNDQNKKAVDEAIAQMKASVPKGTQIPVAIKQQMESMREKVNSAEPERKELVKQIEAIRNTLPYDRALLTSNMLVPLDDEHFRDNPDIVAFKYGGNISIFGYVTNIISEEEKPEQNNDFASLYDTVNKIMINMFKGQDRVFVVHPVALFY